MTITYPLSMPATPGFTDSSIRLVNNNVVNRSPFTGATQVLARIGSYWEVTYSLPPMTRAQAADWTAFLVSLRGQYGTFYAFDPDATSPRGTATNATAGVVDGANQTGNSIDTDGWATSTSGLLLAGDYIQIGDQLYMVVNDVHSDSNGDATIDIVPSIRTSPADNAAIIVENPKGKFRLSDPTIGWSTNNVSHYGVTFSGFEVVT